MDKENLIGKIYNYLKVLNKSVKTKDSKQLFLCECLLCGNKKNVNKSDLKRGFVKSCGCLQYRKGKENPKFTGYEEISGNFLDSLKRNSKRRNIIFNITVKDIWDLYIKQNRKCALSDIDIDFGKDKGLRTASLDRIDSSRGYVLDNIQWVHKDVNRMKNVLNENDFFYFCNLINKYNGDKK